MKTIEQLLDNRMGLSHPELPPEFCFTEEEIIALRLESYRAGMTRAAEIAEQTLELPEYQYQYATNVSTKPRDAILNARDAITTIDK